MDLIAEQIRILSIAFLIAVSGFQEKDVQQSTGPQSVSWTCNIDLSSPTGGRIDFARFDPSPKIPPINQYSTFWHPPTSGPSLDFIIGYSHTLTPFDFPRGARVRITPPTGAKIDAYSAEVSIDDKAPFKFDNSNFDASNDVADLIINGEGYAAKQILGAIHNKKPISVIIYNGGSLIARGTIYTSNTDERDFIFENIIKLSNANDPRYCHQY